MTDNRPPVTVSAGKDNTATATPQIKPGAYYEEESDDLLDDTSTFAQPPSSASKPGITRTTGTFTCHTHLAHQLFVGRQSDSKNNISAIIGLLQFSSRINTIFELAREDDPYADDRLLKIEQALEAAETYIDEQRVMVKVLLGDGDNVKIEPSISVKPLEHTIEFKTRFAHFGMKLVSSFDKLVQLSLAATHTDRMFDDDWKRCVPASARKIRHAFAVSDHFRASGATRNDFAANNQRAQQALKKYGELEPAVLAGTTRAKRAPKIRQQSALASL